MFMFCSTEGNLGQRHDAGVPRLLADRVDQGVAGQVGVLLEKPRDLDDLGWIGRGGQDMRHQGVRDGCGQLQQFIPALVSLAWSDCASLAPPNKAPITITTASSRNAASKMTGASHLAGISVFTLAAPRFGATRCGPPLRDLRTIPIRPGLFGTPIAGGST